MEQNDIERKSGTRDVAYCTFIDSIKSRIGLKILSDDELIALAFDDISHTFTQDERNYN
jgi:hypothetical protein